MFIKISNPSNPLRIENFLRPYKRGEKPFTPEVAREILTMTNHKKNICDTLQLIAEQPNQADYKEIILSVFDHREQPTDTVILGKKLAAANGFENELNETVNHDYTNDTNDGIVYASNTNQIAAHICAYERPNPALYPSDCTLICTSDLADLSQTDLSPVKSLKFKEGAEANLYYCINLPADLDVSMCQKVYLTGTDLSPVKSLKFKEGAHVYLHYSDNLPADLDVSTCSLVDFTAADLTQVKSLKFADNAHVILNANHNINFPLDFSNCSRVELDFSDIKNIPSIKFKNRQQQKESELKIPKDWHGKITYAEKNNIFSSLLHKINTRS